MTHWLLRALILVTALLLPGMASAQWPEVRVTPRAGLLTPANWFYVEFKQFGVQPMQWTESAILRSVVVGAAAEAAFQDLGVWVRGEFIRSIGTETSVVHAELVPASQANPATVIRTPYRVPTRVTAATVDLVLPLRLRLAPYIQPYVTGGVGAKRYAFDVTEIAPWESQIVLPRDGTVPALNVGGGAAVRMDRFQFDVQVRDAMSRYWGLLQHDVMFLAGVSFQLR
jgi:hypothetical protein